MAIAVGAARIARVVDVQELELFQADLRVDLVDEVPHSLAGADVIAARVQVAGVDAEAEALGAARFLDQLGRLVEVAAEELRRARRVLVEDRAALGLRQRLLDQLHGALAGVRAGVVLEGPGVDDHPHGPDAVADAERVGQGVERFLPHLLVVRGRVDQVDRMDRDDLHLGCVHRLAEGGEVVVGVAGRPPHPRALVEDLDRLAAHLLGALDRLGQATPCGNMGADQHDELRSVNPSSPLRPVTDGRPPHRWSEDGTVQLALRAGPGWGDDPADRGHGPRAIDPGERRADPRRAALARARLGRWAGSVRRSAPIATRRRSSSCWRPAPPTAIRPPVRTSPPGRRSTATAAIAASPATSRTPRSGSGFPTTATPSWPTRSVGRCAFRTHHRTTS